MGLREIIPEYLHVGQRKLSSGIQRVLHRIGNAFTGNPVSLSVECRKNNRCGGGIRIGNRHSGIEFVAPGNLSRSEQRQGAGFLVVATAIPPNQDEGADDER